MRASIAVSAAALAGLLAACSGQQVSSTPPTVSYRVNGSNVADANAKAAQYCQRYGSTAYLQGVANGTATYSCGRATGSASTPVYTGTAQAPVVGSTTATPVNPAPAVTTQCADMLHQDRPGGTDYVGPPVPGCPQR